MPNAAPDIYIYIHTHTLWETDFKFRDTYRLKVKEWKKVFHENGNQKKASITIFISGKIDFKRQFIAKDKESYYIMIRWSVQAVGIKLINAYTPNTGTFKHTKQILTDIKRETDNSIIIVRDFNTSHTLMDRTSRWKINKATVVLNDIDCSDSWILKTSKQ